MLTEADLHSFKHFLDQTFDSTVGVLAKKDNARITDTKVSIFFLALADKLAELSLLARMFPDLQAPAVSRTQDSTTFHSAMRHEKVSQLTKSSPPRSKKPVVAKRVSSGHRIRVQTQIAADARLGRKEDPSINPVTVGEI